MTTPSTMRIFFALDLPVEVKEEIGKYICSLKKKSRTKAIRWTRPENLHITLQFLPEVRREDLSRLLQHVRDKTARFASRLAISFGDIQLFPTAYHPRVIVLDIQPQDKLLDLSRQIGEGILEAHYDIDRRPFRAHMTIGRIKNPQGVSLDFLPRSPDLCKIEPTGVPVNEVVLFRSDPHADGSHYTPLDKLALAD